MRPGRFRRRASSMQAILAGRRTTDGAGNPAWVGSSIVTSLPHGALTVHGR